MRRFFVPLAIGLLLLALAGIGAALWLARVTPSLTEEEVRHAMFAAIQRESPAAFLVTGQLELTVTTRVENSKILLPGVIGLDLGTTRSTVRVPGRVSYGFEVDSLRPEMVRMLEDGVIEVWIPPLAVYSAEADLGQLEVETERGWARAASRRDQVERDALLIVEGTMRRQALAHLRSSYQPRINAAEAMRRLLTPTLQGLGMEAPEFRFRVDENVVIMPSG